jgi:hypothetical protein
VSTYSNPSPQRRILALIAIAALMIISAGFPVPAYGGAFDVRVGEIHITQGIQPSDARFWVPLVAERNTAVRVQVEGVSGIPGPVTGKLKVWVDGREITPPGGVDDLNRTFPPPHNQFIPPGGRFFDLLEYEEKTLNFELLAANYPIAPAANQNVSNNVDFEVQIFAQGDTNPANNLGQVNDLTVKRRGTPWLFKDRIFYFPSGIPQWPVPASNRPNEAFIAPRTGDAMAPAVWPLPDAPRNTGTQTNPIYPPVLPGAYFRFDCDGDGKITIGAQCFNQGSLIGDEAGLLLGKLARRRQLLIQGGFGPDRLVYLYGWVQDGKLAGHDGVALLGSNIGYGMDRPNRGQQIFAHEFGHMAGLPHNNPGRILNDYGWDTGARLHNNPLAMAHGVTGRVKLPSLYDDVMNNSGATRTATTWAELENYTTLLTTPKLDVEVPGARCGLTNTETPETLVVSGIPSRDSLGTQMRASVHRYPWCTGLDLKPDRPNVRLTLRIEEPGSRIRDIQVLINARMVIDLSDGAGHVEKLGPFATPIPILKGTKLHALRIEGLLGDLRAAELKPTLNNPKVEIISPKPMTQLGSGTTITWKASDADVGTTLTYQVAYSPNDGRDFIPLEVDLEEAKLTIDAKLLPTTVNGHGLLRIFANDGVNTSFADVGGLSLGN